MEELEAKHHKVGNVKVSEVEVTRPFWCCLAADELATQKVILYHAVKHAHAMGKTSGVSMCKPPFEQQHDDQGRVQQHIGRQCFVQRHRRQRCLLLPFFQHEV